MYYYSKTNGGYIVMRPVKILIAIIFYIFLVPSMIKSVDQSSFLQSEKKVCITVFIHGAVYSGLSLFHLPHMLKDDLKEDSFYVSAVKDIRDNPLLQQNHVMLDQGWHQVCPEIITAFNQKQLHSQDAKKAAYQFIPAYDAFAQKFLQEQDNVYYTFGHLGLMSQKYREQISYKLYDHLCNTVDEYKKHYDQVHVVVVAHSHGGNIALNLAKSEMFSGRGLVVDDLIMFGTPIQVETAGYAYGPPFKRVINCYSDGDIVQIADKFSTATHRSYQKLSDQRLKIERPVNKAHGVYDVRFLVNSNPRQVDHANMFLLGKSKKACKALDPLPVAALIPVLIASLDNDLNNHIDCNIIDRNQTLCCQLVDKLQDKQRVSTNCFQLAQHLRQLTEHNWQPDDRSRQLVFNSHVGKLLSQAFSSFLKS